MPQGASGSADTGLLTRVAARERWEATAGRGRQRMRYLLYGSSPEPIPSYRGPIEDPRPGRSGVCCSGGGVRSAAFNLGALQALQDAGELQRADYLAAVSGGSYIAAAFAMIAKTWAGAERPAAGRPGCDDSDPALVAAVPPFAPGSPEVQYLRNRSSYLAPSGMDKLYLVYRIVLGMLFNVAFLSLPLFAVGLWLGVFAYRPALHGLLGHCGAHCSAQLPRYLWLPPLIVAGVSAILGLWALLWRARSGRLRRFVEISSTRLLVLAAILAWFTILLPLLAAALSGDTSTGVDPKVPGIVGGAGFTTLLLAVSAHLRNLLGSPAADLAELNRGRQWLATLTAKARLVLAYTAGAIIGPALLLSAMVFAVSLALEHSRATSINVGLVLVAAAALAVFATAYVVVDLTTWSLHPFYKRRLCTAFALKRVRPSDQRAGEEGRSERVIDQDEQAGIVVERDFDTLVPLSDTALQGGSWPALLVCASANVSDPGATPPGRQVTSFTFSAHAVGGPLVGGIATADFEHAFARGGTRRRDLTLPAAVAMSGAALSPSMGKQTRRPLRFLMALANIRLGVWVPNPRWVAGTQSWQRYGRARPSYLLRELLGRNRVDAKYLYVTDGGHYENLGLVELLRRGCTRIYCFDASGGDTFKELGDAVALARSELGVEIEIAPDALATGADGLAKQDSVLGSFSYRDGTAGTLIYGRSVLTAAAPWDVQAYHQLDHSFPHDSTADQLYTDQRFEAYRALGVRVGASAIALASTPARVGAAARIVRDPAAAV